MCAVAAIGWFFAYRPRQFSFGPRFWSKGQPPTSKGSLPGEDAVLRELDRAIAKDPRNAELVAKRARHLVNAGRVDQAKADVAKALAIEPSQPMALLVKASIEVMSGLFKEGMTSLEQARVAGANPHHVNLLLAVALRQDGQLDAAKRMASSVILSNPFDVAALMLRGEIALYQGRFEDARQDIDEALRTSPPPPLAYLLRGIAFVGSARWEEAIASFGRAQELTPRDPVAQFGIDIAWRALGNDARTNASPSKTFAASPEPSAPKTAGSPSPRESARALLELLNKKAPASK